MHRAGVRPPNLVGEGFSLHPPCLQDTLCNPSTGTHLGPLPALHPPCWVCDARADSRSLRLEEQPGKEDQAPGHTRLHNRTSPAGGTGSLSSTPVRVLARDPVGLIDSLARGPEHFPTPHCLYKLIPQMMFIKSTSGEIFVFSTAWHLCGDGKRRGRPAGRGSCLVPARTERRAPG